MTAENFLDTIGVVGIIIALIPIIYSIMLYNRVSDTAHFSNKQNKKLDEIKETLEELVVATLDQSKKLERIAKALESNDEPDIIEKEDA